jgi:hypothetical protein
MSNDLIPTTNESKLPALKSNLPARNRTAKFVGDVKQLAEATQALQIAVHRIDSELVPADDVLEQAAAQIAEFERAETKIAKLKELAEIGARPATREQIAEEVTVMVGSIPSGLGKDAVGSIPSGLGKDATIYARALAEDIGDSEPTLFALKRALRAMRRTTKWHPPLCDVLKQLESADGEFWHLRGVVNGTTKLVTDARAHLDRQLARLGERDAINADLKRKWQIEQCKKDIARAKGEDERAQRVRDRLRWNTPPDVLAEAKAQIEREEQQEAAAFFAACESGDCL